MKKFVAVVATLLLATGAFAGPISADPYGFELGVATRTQVESSFKDNRLSETGVSAITGGKMLEAANPDVGPEGLERALFVFDAQDRLAAVEMTLPKDFGGRNVAAIADQLARKYVQQSRNLPHVGNASARYVRGNSVVIIDAPHLSFKFTVTYMSDDFQRRLSAYQKAKEQQKVARSRDAL
jgi:hypothetical protein